MFEVWAIDLKNLKNKQAYINLKILFSGIRTHDF